MENEFVDILGFEGLYQINRLGVVKSLDRIVSQTKSENGQPKKGCTMTPCLNNKGYLKVVLSKGGIKKTCKIHRLIAIHFIPEVIGKTFINHKDGNKLNNSIDNLEWCTNKENSTHAYDIGLNTKSLRPVFCTKTGKEWPSISKCSRDIGVSTSMLGMYLSGKVKNKTTINYSLK